MIVSIKDVRRELKPQLSTDTSNNAYIVQAIRMAERRFVDRVGFEFVPVIQVVGIWDAYREDRVLQNGYDLQLPSPLLAVTEIANGSTVLVSGDYRLESLDPLSVTPYGAVRLLTGTWIEDNDDEGITIDGTWGYHRDYTNAWLPSGDTVRDAPLSSSATSLTVTDADGLDAYGEIPRFSPGQVLQIEDEWLEVLAVNPTTNVLAVRRGLNGCTAVSHVQGTAITIWEADPQAVRAITRWVALALDRRGAFDQLSMQGMATLQFPTDMPDEVAHIAAAFRALFDVPLMGV